MLRGLSYKFCWRLDYLRMLFSSCLVLTETTLSTLLRRCVLLPIRLISSTDLAVLSAQTQVIDHRLFAGLHFTGSTHIFKSLWKQIANNMDKYLSYPRIVGETGGKNWQLVHKSADVRAAAIGAIRGAFEYQGQKCSAASRAYIPSGLWSKIKDRLVQEIQGIK